MLLRQVLISPIYKRSLCYVTREEFLKSKEDIAKITRDALILKGTSVSRDEIKSFHDVMLPMLQNLRDSQKDVFKLLGKSSDRMKILDSQMKLLDSQMKTLDSQMKTLDSQMKIIRDSDQGCKQ
jgi:hypothetical protein